MNLKTSPAPMRLFALRDLTTGKLVPNEFFASKPEAKRRRDALGDHIRVTPCPDHWRYGKQH